MMERISTPNIGNAVGLAILIALVGLLGGCGRTPQSFETPNMTSLSPRLQPLFEKTKTVCFGRFVIEVPDSATLVFGVAEAGPEISSLPGEAARVEHYVATDLTAIETSREFLDKRDHIRLPLFGKVIDGIVPGQKITFDSKDGVGYYINSYVPIGSDLFIQHVSSIMHQEYNVELFNDVAGKLRGRADGEIPSEPGTCIAGGFLPMALEYERIRFGVRLAEFPDVHLSIDVHKNRATLEVDADLERTLKEGEELAKAQGHGAAYARIKTFRRGTRQLGAWKGSEMLARKPAYKQDTEAHEFYFHSLGAVHDPLQPQLDIRLDSGVKNDRTARTKPSITDEEAVALWDKLIGTIRVRPTTAAKPISAAPAKMPLGKLAATGEVCTQQGWWQCTDIDNIEGGRRRHFKLGESMPYVFVLSAASPWQKLSGNRPRHKASTAWKLVAYDDEPAMPSV